MTFTFEKEERKEKKECTCTTFHSKPFLQPNQDQDHL